MTRDQIDARKAYLGISLGKLYYSTKRLNAYCAWATVNAPSDFGFLIGDDIYAITLQAFSRLSYENAIQRARQKGDDIERQLNKIGIKRGLSFTIVRWRKLSERVLYDTIFKAAVTLCADDIGFREALRRQALTNLKYRFKRSGSPSPNARRLWSLLEFYILHEIAGLITMSEDLGYAVEVYPGRDLDLLQQIYEGKWKQISSLLPKKLNRSFYELELN